HTSSARAEQYAPWDAETLLAWAPGQRGHNGKRPIAMCVHYAAALVSAAQAVGIPARCAVLTEAVNGMQGHFVAEVWEPDLGKWVVVDPNADAMFVQDGIPMSMTEIQNAGQGIGELIEFGPGTEFQLTFPHIVEFAEQNLKKGVCFRHRSVWHRADLLTSPWMSPPAHGSLSYCETGLVWERRELDRGFGMFPAFGDSSWFDAAPAGWL
ncbi:MAG TPA: transglutaminase domain-containing protein, partial [Candidatus Latescibacteria bacterium]|nr:transglutaminase domain-containing protein [Candidatus Latescibacterota bacterium]